MSQDDAVLGYLGVACHQGDYTDLECDQILPGSANRQTGLCYGFCLLCNAVDTTVVYVGCMQEAVFLQLFGGEFHWVRSWRGFNFSEVYKSCGVAV